MAAWALSRGWVDRRDGEQILRKPRKTPVPTVGGMALALAWAAASLWDGHWPPAWLALCAALVLGGIDDRRPHGLGVIPKLIGQLIVSSVFAYCTVGSPVSVPLVDWLAAVALALVCMNAMNTFDCSDGATSTLGAVALLGRSPCASALLGFMPFNLLVRRGPERVPVAYLGDSGSHLVGIAMASDPRAWPFLVLPVADMLRLSVVRWRLGRRPWMGDRRHWAHRLEAAGVPPLGIMVIVLTITLPVHLAPSLGYSGSTSVAVSLALYSLSLLLTPQVD